MSINRYKNIFFYIIILTDISFILSYDVSSFNKIIFIYKQKDLWAIVITTSMYYENYRHSVNSLLMYNILRDNGIPDEHVREKII